jgi:hypothetical protein
MNRDSFGRSIQEALMATDPHKRQRKLEKRNAKRKEKHHQLVREKSVGIAERMAASASAPILDTWVSEDLFKQGLGWILLSRRLPNDLVAVAVFLVDRYCLGVKNAMAEIVGQATYETQFIRKMRSKFEPRAVSPATARKWVEEAVAYARCLGFGPHVDYAKASRLFGSINAAESSEQLDFGRDGKPLFIAGPNDTPERCRHILSILLDSRGQGNFDFVVPLGDPSNYLPQALKSGQLRLVGEDDHGGYVDRMIDVDDDPFVE